VECLGANPRRDGRTSEEQTKQILGIAAILPGQDPRRRFSIPARKSLDKIPTRSSLDQHHHHSYAVPSNGGLIEGQGPEERPGLRRHSQSVAMADMPAIQKSPPGFWHPKPRTDEQRDLSANLAKMRVSDLAQNSTAHRPQQPPTSHPTKAENQEHEKPPPPRIIRRQDSETNVIDEFHDAEA
jgi:oxysterol-binding protein-related protein 8